MDPTSRLDFNNTMYMESNIDYDSVIFWALLDFSYTMYIIIAFNYTMHMVANNVSFSRSY